MRCNAAAAPATVSGERPVTTPLGPHPGKADGPRDIREPGDLPSREQPAEPGGVPRRGSALVSEARSTPARLHHLPRRPRARRGRDPGGAAPARRRSPPCSTTRPPLELRAVSCLASCERGCAAAISAPGKWSYLLGGLSGAVAADLLTYGAAYAASRTGTVMPSKRPASLAKAVLGRFPTQELA